MYRGLRLSTSHLNRTVIGLPFEIAKKVTPKDPRNTKVHAGAAPQTDVRR